MLKILAGALDMLGNLAGALDMIGILAGALDVLGSLAGPIKMLRILVKARNWVVCFAFACGFIVQRSPAVLPLCGLKKDFWGSRLVICLFLG